MFTAHTVLQHWIIDRECIHYESRDTMLSLWVARNDVRLI